MASDALLDHDRVALAARWSFDNRVRHHGDPGGRTGFGGIDAGLHFSHPRPAGREDRGLVPDHHLGTRLRLVRR